MSSLIVVGTQWGDEGKGKVVDYLAEGADIIVRYAGGPNAGHTIVVDGKKLVLHLVPSGALRQGKRVLLGAGMVVDTATLIKEICELQDNGHLNNGELGIDYRLTIITEADTRLDKLRETARGTNAIGTTGRGIGPAYEARAGRYDLRFSDLLNSNVARERLQAMLDIRNPEIQRLGEKTLSVDALAEKLLRDGEVLRPFAADVPAELYDARRDRKNVLFEGAQGTLLDVGFGTRPYVTSSNPIAGGACTGAGVGPTFIDKVVGVTKAYTTRVGGGPFPTEITGALLESFRTVGGEYGATTGRPRRCGWLDLVVLRTAAMLNGLGGLIVTKVDVLEKVVQENGLTSIPVCVAYEIDGRRYETVPPQGITGKSVKPEYVEFQVGTKFDVNTFLSFVENRLEISIDGHSNGAERTQITHTRDIWT